MATIVTYGTLIHQKVKILICRFKKVMNLFLGKPTFTLTVENIDGTRIPDASLSLHIDETITTIGPTNTSGVIVFSDVPCGVHI